MKKDRNAFFSEAGMQTSGYMGVPNMPMMGPQMMGQGMPMQQASSSSNFYTGPMNTPMPMMNNQVNNSELESRIARIERQINRLETRINKIELGPNTVYNNEDINVSSNMYMV